MGQCSQVLGECGGLGFDPPVCGFRSNGAPPGPSLLHPGPGAGFTGNGAFQCFRVLGVPDAQLGRKWPRPGLGRWVQVRGPEGCPGLRASTASAPPGRTSGGAAVPLGIARGVPRPSSRWAPRAAAYAALRRDPAAPVDGFTSSWVARRHAPGPRVGAVGPSSASGRDSSGMWSRPSEFAGATSAVMCRVLGRTPLSLQRLTVSGWVSRRRLISAHGRPDCSLNRTRRCGKSPGKTWVLLLSCVRCRGIEPVLQTYALALSPYGTGALPPPPVRSQRMGEARSGWGHPPLRTSMCAGFLRWPGPPTPAMGPRRAGGPAGPSRRLDPYDEGSSAFISSQLDFFPSPAELTAATRYRYSTPASTLLSV